MIEEITNRPPKSASKENAANSRLNIILKSYDAKILDQTTRKVKDTLSKMGIPSWGPIPLVAVTKNFVVLKSPHVNKDARQNFRLRSMKRLIQTEESRSVISALHGMTDIHPSVNIEIKFKENKAVAK